eukprot:14734683-Alexandrium_andersonii.AAC.1
MFPLGLRHFPALWSSKMRNTTSCRSVPIPTYRPQRIPEELRDLTGRVGVGAAPKGAERRR